MCNGLSNVGYTQNIRIKKCLPSSCYSYIIYALKWKILTMTSAAAMTMPFFIVNKHPIHSMTFRNGILMGMILQEQNVISK